MISRDESVGEIGFEGRQILRGRQTGLPPWARRAIGEAGADALLKEITDLVLGKGPLGALICGTMDLDNIDNVYRIAFHMGLQIDRALPIRLAQGIIGVSDGGNIVIVRRAESDVVDWLSTRREVYSRLMPAEPDFGLKIMIIYAAIKALRNVELASVDWNLTEVDFLGGFRVPVRPSCATRSIVDDGGRVEYLPATWMTGTRPAHTELMSFSEEVSGTLGRDCLAYGIKDKRDRQVSVEFDNGQKLTIGADPHCWLFGVGSSKRQPFTADEAQTVIGMAADRFGTAAIGDSVAGEDELPMFASLRA